MTKFKKISIVFLSVLLLIIFYIIITNKKVDNEMIAKLDDKNMEQSNVNDVKNSEEDNKYNELTAQYFSDYANLIKSNDFTIDDLKETENKILSLKVPTEYKDLHINFILSIAKMKQYLEEGEEEKKQESEDIIRDIKLNYDWINI